MNEYVITAKIELKDPIRKDFVEMLVTNALKEMNTSVLDSEKEKSCPISVKVSIKK